MSQMQEVIIHAVFESRNGGEADAIRVDAMTHQQFSYVCWYERRYLSRCLVAIIGQELSQEG